MEITVTTLTIDDITGAIRTEIRNYFEGKDDFPSSIIRDEIRNYFEKKDQENEIGGIDLAIELTGLAKPTIYGLASKRKIPHSKRGKKLYFSRKELLDWLTKDNRKSKGD